MPRAQAGSNALVAEHKAAGQGSEHLAAEQKAKVVGWDQEVKYDPLIFPKFSIVSGKLSPKKGVPKTEASEAPRYIFQTQWEIYQ